MFETKKTLQVSQQQLELLERALQTQIKIQSVEARIGASEAQERLNETKRMLVQVEAQRCPERRVQRKTSWLQQSLRMS